jgi:hypothetical protein
MIVSDRLNDHEPEAEPDHEPEAEPDHEPEAAQLVESKRER